MSTNNPNHPHQNLNNCGEKNSFGMPNLDDAPGYCSNTETPNTNKRAINDESLNWLKEQSMQKTGYGAKVDCDPMQKGLIANDPMNPQRNTLYRYSKSIRGTDEAMLDLFKNVIVIDEDGRAWGIPIIFGPPEKAVAAIVQDNVRKDETLVVDRLKLPMLALNQTNFEYDLSRYTYHKALNYFRGSDGKPGMTLSEKQDRDTVLGFARGIPVNIGYTLTAWTMYREDMNQIIEQILSKFSHLAYIKVTGVPWEVVVKLDSVANNLSAEPGNQAIRIIKFEFNFTTQSYIPQPIDRKKAILTTKIDLVDGMSEEEITEVMAKIETSVKDFEC